MPTIFDQPNSDHTNSGTISDGVTIAASGVRLTNTDSGRIYGGVSFTTGGSTLINQLGGVISLTQSEGTFSVLVTGSEGADTVDNSGLIKGAVSLGGGDDIFIDRDGATNGLDLGAGNDIYRVEGSQARFLSAAAGDGYDRLILAGTGQYWSGDLTGFEELQFETGGNFTGFSGYQSITISPQASFVNPWPFINLLDCLNPLADLAANGLNVILQNSSLHSISGGDGSEVIELGPNSSVANGIALGGGDDGLTFTSNQTSGAPAIAVADGGAGSDALTLQWFTAGDRSYDFSSVQGFEKLNVNLWLEGDAAIARVANLSGLTDVNIGDDVTLILSDVVSPDARVGGGFGGGLTLEAGTVIDRYGFPEDGYWDRDIDKVQGDPALSTTIINRGTIEGAVRFYIGDDVYDGREGSVGGIVYGNAGNDMLLGGAAAEIMQGGYGADILEGNGGADTLTGGGGSDLFRGRATDLNGDTITDLSAGDKIIISDASLAGFSFSMNGYTLTYTGGTLTLSGFTGQLQLSAAEGGGVQLTVVDGPTVDARNDFNGDGRSDILWRIEDGIATNWLAQANGSFTENWANAYVNVSASWQVAGIGDFNGDGRDDVLWRNNDGRVIDWLGRADGSFGSNPKANNTVSTSWEVAGVGDFNGDGRDDVLWRNAFLL
jgi:hypothetical protein